MYRRLVVVAGVTITLLTGLVPIIQAQSTADPALVEVVAEAFSNTLSIESLHITSQSLTEIRGLPANMSLGQQSAETLELNFIDTEIQAQGTRTTKISLPTGEMALALEYVVIAGKTYARFTEVPATMEDTLPKTWVDWEMFTAETEAPQMLTAFSNLNPETPESLLGFLKLPISTESITDIKRLADSEIDDQAMSVYQVTLDSAVVLDSDAANLLNIQFGAGNGGGFPGGMLGGQMPEGMPAITPPAEGMTAPSPEDVQITLAVYIGADERVARIYSVIATAPSTTETAGGFALTLTLTTQVDYQALETPTEITAPEINSR